MNYFAKYVAGVALLAVIALSATGCDSNSEEDSNFAFLEGSWVVLRVSRDGATYDLQHETTTLTFFEQDSGGRRFLLRGSGNGEVFLEIEGILDLQSDNGLFLSASAFERGGALLDYDIESSARVQLITTSTGGSDFVNALIGISLGQNAENVVVEIERNTNSIQ